MLQQTRVAVVEERYKQFLHKFPSVSRLARAREDSVLAAWSGLGYYRRARNLHAAARQVARDGGLPTSAAELAQLPGIGRYTAAAVASIAFDEPVAVVDGNVERVVQRLAGKGLFNGACWQMAQELLETKRPGDFNQAMMELGATTCLPGTPLCARCPVGGFCGSRGAISEKNSGAQPRAARKKATLRYLLARRNSSVLLERRPANAGLMPGMWELPQVEHGQARNGRPILKLRHSITVTDYSVLVFSGEQKRTRGMWVPLSSIKRLPLTGLAQKILRRLNLTTETQRSGTTKTKGTPRRHGVFQGEKPGIRKGKNQPQNPRPHSKAENNWSGEPYCERKEIKENLRGSGRLRQVVLQRHGE